VQRSTAAPGKRTRTGTLPPSSTGDEASVVQRRGEVDAANRAAWESTDPHATASDGVASATESLPHHEQIQASFGKHDVSHVRAQIGGNAAVASRDLGASAFAVGDRVGFASAPDLHTAAHEAAHVVQQRGGVQLEGGMDGGADDPHEQHADRVADAVVRGESAEALLDPFAGQRGGMAVQRKSKPDGMVSAEQYLEFNSDQARTAIFTHLLKQRLPKPHPRMEWRNEKAFFDALFFSLTGLFSHFQLHDDITQLLFPGNPYEQINQMRPTTKAAAGDVKGSSTVGTYDWSAPIGVAIAQLVEQAAIASVYRLGPRWVTIADTRKNGVDPSEIARSHPMDRHVVVALCKEGVFELLPEAAGSKSKTEKKEAQAGPRKIELTPVGKEHPDLWNWVRASPTDATPEEVSAELFGYMTERDHETRADYYAAFLTAAPPMFGIPPQWAKTHPKTEGFKPAKIAAADTDPDHQLAALGGSVTGDDHRNLADEQALAEIGAAPAKGKQAPPQGGVDHENLVADARAQATFLKTKLAAWKQASMADKALAFLERRTHDSADPATWKPVLVAQSENLKVIATGLRQLDDAAAQMKLEKTGAQAKPLFEIVRFYGDATATAHLNQTCGRMIARAANAQSALAGQALQGSVQEMDMSVDAMGTSENDPSRRRITTDASKLHDESVAMQTRIARGEKASGEQLEDLQLRIEEKSLESKFKAIEFALNELESAARAAGEGMANWFAARFSSDFRNLEGATGLIRSKLTDIKNDWESRQKDMVVGETGDLNDDPAKAHRNALETAKTKFRGVRKSHAHQRVSSRGREPCTVAAVPRRMRTCRRARRDQPCRKRRRRHGRARCGRPHVQHKRSGRDEGAVGRREAPHRDHLQCGRPERRLRREPQGRLSRERDDNSRRLRHDDVARAARRAAREGREACGNVLAEDRIRAQRGHRDHQSHDHGRRDELRRAPDRHPQRATVARNAARVVPAGREHRSRALRRARVGHESCAAAQDQTVQTAQCQDRATPQAREASRAASRSEGCDGATRETP
jgi:hypothetical protein